MDPAADRGAQLIARNRELLAKALEARERARAVVGRAERGVHDVMLAQLARSYAASRTVTLPNESGLGGDLAWHNKKG